MAVDPPVRAPLPQPMPHLDGALSEILGAEGAIGCVFQPIVGLSTGEIAGYEVLTRLDPARIPLPGITGPLELLALARSTGRLLECDLRLQRAAIEGLARHVDATRAWFAINVDPRGVDDPAFTTCATRALLAENGVATERIVVELADVGATERVDRLAAVVRECAEQGFRVALDDLGSGDASLLGVVRIRPQLVKIDAEMIRGVDRDPLRANLLQAIADFGRRSNVTVVAEGIETEGELAVVIRAGVQLAQGHLLGHPTAAPDALSAEVRALVRSTAARIDRATFRSARRQSVGSLDIAHPALRARMTCEQFDALLRDDPSRSAYAVIDERQRTVGLVTRESFFEKTSGPFGFAFHAGKSIAAIMDRQPLRIEAATSVDAASRLATARDHHAFNHPIVVESDGRYVGLISMQTLLRVVTELEIRHATYASPLTGLPGNVVIDSEIRRALETGRKGGTAFVYVDIDNFKALNDAYGFAAGDDVLRLLAELLRETFDPLGEDVLVGHVGGDDFVVIAPEASVDAACARLGTEFDVRVRGFYAPEDLARGGIASTDRRGHLHFFPVAALSIAIVVEHDLVNQELHEVARMAADLKRLAKLEAAYDPRSRCVRNRRSGAAR